MKKVMCDLHRKKFFIFGVFVHKIYKKLQSAKKFHFHCVSYIRTLRFFCHFLTHCAVLISEVRSQQLGYMKIDVIASLNEKKFCAPILWEFSFFTTEFPSSLELSYIFLLKSSRRILFSLLFLVRDKNTHLFLNRSDW